MASAVLIGVSPIHGLYASFRQTGRITDGGPVRILEATRIVGETTLEAFAEAKAWLAAGVRDAGSRVD